MDYDSIFSDLKNFEDQLLTFIEIYYNELNKENKELLISIKNWDEPIWRNKLKLYLENYKEKMKPKDNEKTAKEKLLENSKINNNSSEIKYNNNHFIRIEKLLEHFANKDKKKGKLEFNNKVDLSELLYEIHYIKINGKFHTKTSGQINFNMLRSLYKELIQIVKIINSKYKENINTPFEFLLRLYEDQYYFIKYINPDFENIKLNDYATKELKMKILIYLNKNLNSENSFELNPLKEEFISFYENNNNDIIKNSDFFIYNDNKKKDAISSMFEFAPFKLSNFDLKDDKNNESKEEEKRKKIYIINNDDEDDFEDQVNSFSNNSSISNENNNEE